MEYRYKPSDRVCSQEMIIELDGDIVKKVTILGGCAGNTVGVSNLVAGMKIDDAIKRLKGIPCGMRGTSCPDQLAIALEEAKKYKKTLY
ncbi:MAG: TIGR03905 family TSCPD domain-containing protein [Clostridia bacterium]